MTTTSSAIAPASKESLMAIAETALIQGDLRAMSQEQRIDYYLRLCDSVGLNPYSKPFIYVEMKGKLVLYPTKSVTNQLAKIHGLSFSPPDVKIADDMIMVTVTVKDRNGRTDTDMGIVPVPGGKGEDRANAIMKAITKAKRRAVFSLVGMNGVIDEIEGNNVDIIPNEIAESLPTVDRYAIQPKPVANTEFAARIQYIREGLEIDKNLVMAKLVEYGTNHPMYLTEKQCNDLVVAMATYAVDSTMNPYEINASYHQNVPTLIDQGMDELEAIQTWINHCRADNVKNNE